MTLWKLVLPKGKQPRTAVGKMIKVDHEVCVDTHWPKEATDLSGKLIRLAKSRSICLAFELHSSSTGSVPGFPVCTKTSEKLTHVNNKQAHSKWQTEKQSQQTNSIWADTQLELFTMQHCRWWQFMFLFLLPLMIIGKVTTTDHYLNFGGNCTVRREKKKEKEWCYCGFNDMLEIKVLVGVLSPVNC